MKTNQSRRQFLQGTGALVVTFSLNPLVGEALAQNAAGFTQPKTVALDEVEGFVAINRDGTVSIYSGKVDLGTGVKTALTQIAADELDVPFAKVNVIQGDTLTTPDQGPTFGSLSIQIGGMQIRQACATAREALKEKAASRLGVASTAVTTKDGACIAGNQSVPYVALLSDNTINLN